jgi:hypothetical protein
MFVAGVKNSITAFVTHVFEVYLTFNKNVHLKVDELKTN